MSTILKFPPVVGFETQHRHYHTDMTGRMLFNALRILSYIPIISTVSALIRGCLEVYYTKKKLGESSSKNHQRLNVQNQGMEILCKDMKNHNEEREAVEPTLMTNDEIIQQNISKITNNGSADVSFDQQVKGLEGLQKRLDQSVENQQAFEDTLKLLQENLTICGERLSRNCLILENLKRAITADETVCGLVEDANKNTKEEQSALKNRLERLVIEALWPLGILLLPVDLYCTALRTQKIEVVTERAV